MLLSLAIRDFVLVDSLELHFQKGFGTLTGETGAGKSILIDALALALGERADPGMIRNGKEKAEVSASFDLTHQPALKSWLAKYDMEEAEDEIVLRRVIESNGRSRAYINGRSATAQQMREVSGELIDIHGQHAHYSLLRPDAQRNLLDAYGGFSDLGETVAADWRIWQKLEEALNIAQAGSEASAKERDMLAWQIGELEQLCLTAPEWEELEAEQRLLAGAAGLIENAQTALSALSENEQSAENLVDQAANSLSSMLAVDGSLEPAAGMLSSVQAEISEVITTLRRYIDRIDLNPDRLKEVERRMDAILTLARKHRANPAQLPELLETWKSRLENLEEAADIESLREKTKTAQKAYQKNAEQLTQKRQQAAKTLSKAVSAQMQELALASGRFEIALLPLEKPLAQGLEQVEYQIAGLSDQTARPLAKIASGGELSRISLALQVVASMNTNIPTLIFDEVDVGIGGGVAETVGRLLHQLGKDRQVLCVTHLPQVASRANWHWQVSKSAAENGVLESRIAALEGEARVEEIARMLGGLDLTSATRNHAREMLQGTRKTASG